MPEEVEEEHGTREEVQDTVPDHLRRRLDDISSLGACPADRVEDEQEREPTRGLEIARTQGTVGRESGAGAMPEERIPEMLSVKDVALPK